MDRVDRANVKPDYREQLLGIYNNGAANRPDWNLALRGYRKWTRIGLSRHDTQSR